MGHQPSCRTPEPPAAMLTPPWGRAGCRPSEQKGSRPDRWLLPKRGWSHLEPDEAEPWGLPSATGRDGRMLRECGHAHACARVRHPCPQVSIGDSPCPDQRGNVWEDPNPDAGDTPPCPPSPSAPVEHSSQPAPSFPPTGLRFQTSLYSHCSPGDCTTHFHLKRKANLLKSQKEPEPRQPGDGRTPIRASCSAQPCHHIPFSKLLRAGPLHPPHPDPSLVPCTVLPLTPMAWHPPGPSCRQSTLARMVG